MKHDDDHSVEVLFRQSLRASIDAEPTGECLDAEVLAAWTEEGLRPDERRAAEAHMAGCSRCQSMAAALIRCTPAPTAPQASWFRAWNLQWLVPLTAGAVVVAVWFELPERHRTTDSVPSASDERLTPRQFSDAVPNQPSAEPNHAHQQEGNRSVEAAAGRTESLDDKASEGAKTKEQQRQLSATAQLERTAPAPSEQAASREKKPQAQPGNAAEVRQESTEEKPGAPTPQKTADNLAKVAPPATPPSTADTVAAASPTPATPPGAKPAPQAIVGAAASPTGNATEPPGPAGRRDQAAAKA